MAREMDLTLGHYQFTRNWFRNRNLPTFREFVHPEWAGRPMVYLEIGVFEAMSLCWMMEHVLTNEFSRAVGVDPWLMTTKLSDLDMDCVMSRAMHNTDQHHRCQLVRGHSSEVLRRMAHKRGGFANIQRGTVDVAMIDGNHWAPYVYDDARLCLELVKPGGWLMFDDVENDVDKGDGHVKEGLEHFVRDYDGQVEEIWRHQYMVCLRRIT